MNIVTRRLASKALQRQSKLLNLASTTATKTDQLLRDAFQSMVNAIDMNNPVQSIDEIQQHWNGAIKHLPDTILHGIRDVVGFTQKSLLQELGIELAAGFGSPPNRPPNITAMLSAFDGGGSGGGIPIFQLTKADVDKLIYSSGWQQRLDAVTKLSSGRQLGPQLHRMFSQGASVKQMVKELEPIVNGVRSTAKRIARHEAIHSSGRMARETWSQLGDMIAGYQIHGVMDDRIRPEHKARNGTVYWREPRNGQKSSDEMPHPPYEADGSIAYNCRCFLSPVLAGMGKDKGPQFDSTTASLWFDDAPTREKMNVLGPERYSLLTARYGGDVTWAQATNAAGDLISLDDLRHQLAV